MARPLEQPALRVDGARLQRDLDELAAIGRRADHGIYRMAFTEGDLAGRAWLQRRIEESGLVLHVDEAANIHARLGWDGTRPSVMAGSHIDSVPGAGHLDGALGVVAALECLRRIQELDLPLRHPLEAVAFTDEEGRFGGMLGSQAMAGKLTPEDIYTARDLEGASLVEVMAAHGFDALKALRAHRMPESLLAFVELHIEQGPVLDRAQVPIGVVEGIVGLFKWEVRLLGTANHAGTTPMDMRQDAFGGLAELSVEIPRILEEDGGPSSVATIGRVELTPGAANVVPGKVVFTLEVRDTDPRILDALESAFRKALSAIARRRGLMFEFEVLSQLPPVHCDPGIIRIIQQVAEEMGAATLTLPSGAAHDTQMMAALTRAGMVFVPSKGGRSHSPAEWTAWEDVETGANVLLNVLYRLAS